MFIACWVSGSYGCSNVQLFSSDNQEHLIHEFSLKFLSFAWKFNRMTSKRRLIFSALQWNPDFSNYRFLELPISRTEFSFALQVREIAIPLYIYLYYVNNNSFLRVSLPDFARPLFRLHFCSLHARPKKKKRDCSKSKVLLLNLHMIIRGNLILSIWFVFW